MSPLEQSPVIMSYVTFIMSILVLLDTKINKTKQKTVKVTSYKKKAKSDSTLTSTFNILKTYCKMKK